MTDVPSMFTELTEARIALRDTRKAAEAARVAYRDAVDRERAAYQRYQAAMEVIEVEAATLADDLPPERTSGLVGDRVSPVGSQSTGGD